MFFLIKFCRVFDVDHYFPDTGSTHIMKHEIASTLITRGGHDKSKAIHSTRKTTLSH